MLKLLFLHVLKVRIGTAGMNAEDISENIKDESQMKFLFKMWWDWNDLAIHRIKKELNFLQSRTLAALKKNTGYFIYGQFLDNIPFWTISQHIMSTVETFQWYQDTWQIWYHVVLQLNKREVWILKLILLTLNWFV